MDSNETEQTDLPAEPPKRSIGDAILNTAAAVKQVMRDYGLNFNQAWTIVKDGMDRQQHFQDNQVRLMLGGFTDVKEDEDEAGEPEDLDSVLTLVDGEGEVH
jgi:hypothetical protein